MTLKSFTAEGVAGGVRVAWETAAEINNLGFYVYRSASEGGERTLVNDVIILGQGTGRGSSYGLLDSTAGEGTWYYWLVDVEYDFSTTEHGPAVATVGAGSTKDDAEKGAFQAVGRISLTASGIHRVPHAVLEAAGVADYSRVAVQLGDAEVAVLAVEGEFILFYAPEGVEAATIGLKDDALRMETRNAKPAGN